MKWLDFKKRLDAGHRTRSGRFVAPKFAVNLEPGFVAAARLSSSKRLVQSVGMQDFPAGALAPSPNKSNIADMAAIRHSMDEVCKRVGHAGGRLGLLIPDVAARVALLSFETLPEDQREAEALVLWKMREYLPYDQEEARLSFQIVAKQSGGVEVLGMAVRLSVLAEYESALAGINGGPALVLPATVALLPLLPENDAGQLLVHISPGALTAVVVASNRLRYWRTRVLEDDLVSIAEEVGREVARILATCQDNLQVQLQNVWWCQRTPAYSQRDLEPIIEKSLGRAWLPAGELLSRRAGFRAARDI